MARPEVTGTCSWLKFIALNFLFILFSPFMPLIKGVIFSSPHPLPTPLPNAAELKTNHPRSRDSPWRCTPKRCDRWSPMCRGKARGGAGATFISRAHQCRPLLKMHSQPRRTQCRPAARGAGGGSVPSLSLSLVHAARPGEPRASLPAPAFAKALTLQGSSRPWCPGKAPGGLAASGGQRGQTSSQQRR